MKTTRIDALTLAGLSGRRYDFRVYVWDTKFKALPGVYVVACRSVEPNEAPRYEPIYVGAAADLSKALHQHPRNDCFQMYYANVIGVLKELDPAARAGIVDDLTAGLRPPCNADDAE